MIKPFTRAKNNIILALASSPCGLATLFCNCPCSVKANDCLYLNMIYANKKVAVKTNIAQQTAQIIANVKELEAKNLISIANNEVLLYPQIWKDKATALNWIKCLYLYCCIKKKIKDGSPLYFKHIETNELIGSMVNKKPKVLIFG